jgi:hypothetical protein
LANSNNFWSGSGANPVGLTPLGLYDDDDVFVEDAPKVASWVAIRLGYPGVQVELTDTQIYAFFEESITEYSAQVNEFNMRDNMFSLQGSSASGSITQKLIKGSPLPYVVELTAQYGTEAGVGGDVDWKKGWIDCADGQQEYDLQSLWAAVSESGNRIEIRRVFHQRTPAVSRGGYAWSTDAGGTSTDGRTYLLGEFGWAGYDGALNYDGSQYMMMPIYDTLLRVQGIELNDTVRRSQFSFELINNKIKIFPMPASGDRLYFQYLVTKDKAASAIESGSANSVVSDYSNAPYTNMLYSNINDVGKNWIRKYTLAISKASLGRILSKYEQIDIPDGSVRLDGADLRREAEQERQTLWQQLRESLSEVGRERQMEKTAKNEQNMKDMLAKVPLGVWIG